MVTFPASPVDGQVHSEENQVWTYREPPGAWSVGNNTGLVTEIVESNLTSVQNWQVWGDMLIIAGSVSTGSSGIAVVFDQAFETVPRVVCQYAGNTANNPMTANADGVSVTGFNARGWSLANNNNASVICNWIAFGEAPDALKKAKQVEGGRAVNEFHDPAQQGSWRINGNTLECWGIASGNDTRVNFPKTFARKPSIQATPDTGSSALGGSDSRTDSVVNATATGFTIQKRKIQGNGSNSVVEVVGGSTFWYAIGELA